MSGRRYLFGDSDAAAQRLKLLARVYQESTRAFLNDAAGLRHFPLVLDLGCGPGYTTHLIADAIECDLVLGLELSPNFIELAQANAGERVTFLQHDIASIPFPSGPADSIYSRFLLTHLRDPSAAVAKWITQLKPAGLLLLEETEKIHTADPTFARYLEIVEVLLAAQSNHLYAGHPVAELDFPREFKSILNQRAILPVRNCDAAQMFLLNLQVWKGSEFVRTNYPCEAILELENALAEISASASSASVIEWRLRQAAWLNS